MPKPTYDAEEVDDLIEKFEKAASRQNANKGSAVKLRAAERDVLAVAEKARDLMQLAVKSTTAEARDLLKSVFGAQGCSRFHRFKHVLESVEFSDMHASDQRWGHLKEVIDMIESILQQLGMFKPWMLTAAPEGLNYRGVRSRFSPGEKVQMGASVSAGENMTFTIEPALPDGLTLDANTGEVNGVLSDKEELPMTDYVITATNGGGDTTATVSFAVCAPPPHTLGYSGVKGGYTGEALLFEAMIEGGAVKDWLIIPKLPQGLAINAQTGSIEGIPLVPAVEKEYTVTASNGGGECETCFTFGVQLAPPTSIQYADAVTAYPMGGVIYLTPEVMLKSGEMVAAPSEDAEARKAPAKRSKSIISTASGLPTGSNFSEARKTATIEQPEMEFSIEPDLPEGMTIIKNTGVITGKPLAPTAEVVYKVTVSNEGGKCSVDLPLAIQLIPPSSLEYQEVEGEFFAGDPVTLVPDVDGLVDEWTVEPALPEGLILDTQMGTISGIPTVATPAVDYVVTAKNSEGEVSTALSFAVLDKPPTDLEYPNLEPAYAVLRKIAPLTALVTGRVLEFSIEPELPAGLSMDPRTGVISGMPTGTVEEADYVITAKNDTGDCTATLHFETRVMPPAELSYPRLDDLYEVGETVELEPEVEGGAETWSVEPELPAGLTLDTATGRISGAPTTTADEATYVVTASNEAGGTSTELTFGVTAPPPAGLTYPEANDDYIVGGEEFTLEPVMERGVCCTFSVSPDLPGGLVYDSATGIISGSPTEPAELATYTVTATNVAGSTSVDMSFSCSEVVEDQVGSDFANMIEGITDCGKLMDMTPDKSRTMADWMVWMVHRAHLNDPTLTDFNFNNCCMPLPHLEPRVSPKLMKALERNTHITSLQLCNSNLQKPDGRLMATSLGRNTTLKNVNIESNNVDSVTVQLMAQSLKENEDTNMEVFKFNNQKNVGEFFGRPVEQEYAELMEKNQSIVKLGFTCQDPHWRLIIDRNIMRNIDVARRKRKGRKTEFTHVIPAEEKTLSKVILSEAPDTPAWEIFEDHEQQRLIATLAADSKRMPTKEQVQANAKAAGKPLKFSEVAPVLSTFRKKLFDAAEHSTVICVDAYGVEVTGVMRGWTEKNEKWALDVWPEDETRLNFTLNKQPVIELSDEYAEWLRPQAE